MTDKNSGAVASNETNEKIGFYNADPVEPRIVVVDETSGRVESRVFHLFIDCNFVKESKPEEIETIGERETKLLGLKVCSVCERRKTGGPAIEALEEVLGEVARNSPSLGLSIDNARDAAWEIVGALKTRGVYLAVRKKGE